MRNLCFFLVKEISKSFVYFQILIQEYINIQKVKEYLYAELVTQALQVSMLRNDLFKARGGKNRGLDLDGVLEKLNKIEKKNGELETQNNSLKLNILDLNEYIVVY